MSVAAIYSGFMTIGYAILLGIIQGITEFLPISSDGHLVVASVFFHAPLQGVDALGFDILLHAGSLLAILLAYAATWKDLVQKLLRRERDAFVIIGLLIVATIPGVIAGLFLEDAIGDLRSLKAAGLGFLATAFILIAGESIGRRASAVDRPISTIGILRALAIGVAQAVAILPGVSRSGSTISLGRALGLSRKNALDFSFLMAAPIIGGAVAKTVVDALRGTVVFPSMGVSVAGLLTSFVVSIGAIAFLRLLVVKRSLSVFAWYLIPLGVVLLLVHALS